LQLGYLDDVLQRLATDAAYAPIGWDAAEVAHFRLIAQCVDAAIDKRDVLTLRLLRLRPGEDDTVMSASLSATRLLTIKFEPSATSMTAVFGMSRVETEIR
jgi:hypothetical protein